MVTFTEDKYFTSEFQSTSVHLEKFYLSQKWKPLLYKFPIDETSYTSDNFLVRTTLKETFLPIRKIVTSENGKISKPLGNTSSDIKTRKEQDPIACQAPATNDSEDKDDNDDPDRDDCNVIIDGIIEYHDLNCNEHLVVDYLEEDNNYDIVDEVNASDFVEETDGLEDNKLDISVNGISKEHEVNRLMIIPGQNAIQISEVPTNDKVLTIKLYTEPSQPTIQCTYLTLNSENLIENHVQDIHCTRNNVHQIHNCDLSPQTLEQNTSLSHVASCHGTKQTKIACQEQTYQPMQRNVQWCPNPFAGFWGNKGLQQIQPFNHNIAHFKPCKENIDLDSFSLGEKLKDSLEIMYGDEFLTENSYYSLLSEKQSIILEHPSQHCCPPISGMYSNVCNKMQTFSNVEIDGINSGKSDIATVPTLYRTFPCMDTIDSAAELSNQSAEDPTSINKSSRNSKSMILSIYSPELLEAAKHLYTKTQRNIFLTNNRNVNFPLNTLKQTLEESWLKLSDSEKMIYISQVCETLDKSSIVDRDISHEPSAHESLPPSKNTERDSTVYPNLKDEYVNSIYLNNNNINHTVSHNSHSIGKKKRYRRTKAEILALKTPQINMVEKK
ncbi:hypothetical protein M8J77_010128 [Diaphorina citri]|nr:hypothetical protein M8J77_010128 [Diaphorina citri]